MSKDVKGVFVRLPLSDAQKTCFYSRHYTGDPTPGLIAIGTPIAGGELEAVDYSDYEPEYHYQGMGCGLEDRGITDRYDAMGYGWDQALERVFSELPETVLLSAAQAALAAAQADIAEEQRISNLRADAVERWTNTCAQQDEVIDGLRAEIARLWSALDGIEMGIDALPDDNEDYSRMTAREMQRQALIIVKEEMKALKGLEA